MARLARLALALAWLPGVCPAAPCDGWPEWQAFSRHFVADGGRVVDLSQDNQPTTSEGQSYGLFFALVANDRPAFEQMLGWTRDKLAAGDLLERLPAWLWGRDKNGQWKVLDDNSASDSDMWIAYDLLEAGRLWREPRYTAMGRLLALRILREEAADLPGLGLTLLPGRVGFWDGKGKARLNPSYLPPQLLARFAHALPDSDWVKAVKSSVPVLLDGAPKGFAPDWLAYQAGKGLQPDADSKAEGSYNAIRVYLWAGMLAPDAPLRAELLKTYRPMAQATVKQGQPPEKVDTRNGAAEGRAPTGFSAAMLPFLDAQNEAAAVQTQLLRMQAMPLSERPNNYYDHVLTLFGQGWQQQRYRFARNGQLLPAWEGSCAASRPASR